MSDGAFMHSGLLPAYNYQIANAPPNMLADMEVAKELAIE